MLNANFMSENMMTRDDVLFKLRNLGFKAYIPRTSSWKYAFIANNNTQTIYFLIGKRCIDFKFYDYIRATKIDEQGRLFTDGGFIVRNYYAKSEVNIHELIIDIAKKFIANKSLDEYFSGHGISVREQKEEYKRSLPKSARIRTDFDEWLMDAVMGVKEDSVLTGMFQALDPEIRESMMSLYDEGFDEEILADFAHQMSKR